MKPENTQMSKRFTDITKWDKPWFRRLQPVKKLIFLYLLDKCDRAGFWEIDMERMEFDLKCDEVSVDVLSDLKDVTVAEGFAFIEDFIDFQYPKGLTSTNRAHRGILEIIKKRSLLDPYKHLTRYTEGCKDKEEETEQEKELLKEINRAFRKFWDAYPRKDGKQKARQAFGKHKCHAKIRIILAAIEDQKKSEKWTKDGGKYISHPTTWINQSRWTDELPRARAPETTPLTYAEQIANAPNMFPTGPAEEEDDLPYGDNNEGGES